MAEASIEYIIAGIPAEVDRLLRERAAQRNQSLNEVVVEELASATIGSRKKADFSDLVGKWVPDEAFDEIIASQRQIDPERWK